MQVSIQEPINYYTRLNSLKKIQKTVGELVIDAEDEGIRDKLLDVQSAVRIKLRSMNYEIKRG